MTHGEQIDQQTFQVRRHTRSHPTRIRALVTAIDPLATSFVEYVRGSPRANSVMRLQVLAVLLDLAAEQRGRLTLLNETLRPLWSTPDDDDNDDDDRRYRPRPRMRVSMVWRRDAALMASLAERYPRVVDRLSATTVFMEPRSKLRRTAATPAKSSAAILRASRPATAPSLSSSGAASKVLSVDDYRDDGDGDDDDVYAKPYEDEDDLRIELSTDSEREEEEEEEEEDEEEDEREQGEGEEREVTEGDEEANENGSEAETVDPEAER